MTSLKRLRSLYFFLVVTIVTLIILSSIYLNKDYTMDTKQDLAGSPFVAYNLEPFSNQTRGDVEGNLTYKILYWTISSGRLQNWFGLGNVPFQQCEYKNCELTQDKKEVNESDAVLFYMFYLEGFPNYRFPWQKWIMKIHESPINEDHRNYSAYNGIFNATWTYSSRSDINSHIYLKRFVPHENITNNATGVDIDYAAGKKRMVVWFVSKCESRSKREIYFSKLYQYIDVDIYGRCGTFDCKRLAKDCDDLLMTKGYRFYLAFENSICDEYLTEKLWRPLEHNTIPIVLGGANYSDILPLHSYINVADFHSPKELADYLILLSTDNKLYNAYFEWKKSLQIVSYGSPVCSLCEYLNRDWNTVRIYTRLDLFWNAQKDCSTPEQFYSNISRDTWEISRVYKYR